ncbi:hypothetical protein TUZN_1807 [Thermoproteus uzoniensis 768-20]|uniref:ASCH domain-containing protein n=1 Tax=Thermoproteus uzoniensis (strain 768-20) TaxID=999630 RepID=F2L3V5_THEU7|nr:ASCH domain-containing protein [Thermoproteus uzoniensis]AEA13267.1 hypothetical protein TUZN_1807 [Thermoproteus uzoniensis 768-20]
MREEMGPILSFKEKYLERVLSGEKRVTIRLGALRPRFQLVYIACCGMLYGEAVITKVEYLRLRDIGEDVLREEGFGSLEEALSELRGLYPRIDLDDVVSVIRFSLIRRYEKPISINAIKRT